MCELDIHWIMMDKANEENVSFSQTINPANSIQDGPPVVFLREASFFGTRKPNYTEFFKHDEMYRSLEKVINTNNITGIQRVNGLWRVYLDNLTDKAKLITEGLSIRGRNLPVLKTNPFRLDSTVTTRIRVQNIPLSAHDGIITKCFVVKGLDVISLERERLRIDSKLTNIENGDRIVTVKTSTLKEPLNRFMTIGKYKAKVIHPNQNPVKRNQHQKCNKCLGDGHTFATCENEWRCTYCKLSGHKKSDCPASTLLESVMASSSSSSFGMPPSGSHEVTDQQTTDSQHVNADDSPVKPPRQRKTVKPGKKHKNDASVPKGQSRMEKFMQGEAITPSRSRSQSVSRSPPTPAETMHDNSKKSRHNSSDSDSDS